MKQLTCLLDEFSALTQLTEQQTDVNAKLGEQRSEAKQTDARSAQGYVTPWSSSGEGRLSLSFTPLH